MNQLTPDERYRYSRHRALPGFEEFHQLRLRNSSVLVVGAGGLGSPVLLYMASSGFGKIGIVDNDVVDASNLQRQVIHSESDLGRKKTESAADSLHLLNGSCRVNVHSTRLSSANAMTIVGEYDIVVDGSDNLPTRYLVNDVCVRLSKPLVYGSVFRFEGQVSVFNYENGPCYRCLFPSPPPPELVPTCETAGVLGVVPGIVGLYQANEAIKIATGLGTSLSGKLEMFDFQSNDHNSFSVTRNPKCPTCGDEATDMPLMDFEAFCAGSARVPLLSAQELQSMMLADDQTIVMLDVRDQEERRAGHIGGLHIPIQELRQRLSELPANSDGEVIVVYCRSGQRSATGARLINEFAQNRPVFSLDGGLVAWKASVDPTIVVA